MRAIAVMARLPISDPGSLVDITLPEPPAPSGHDMLVEVEAVSVNPVDTKQRSAGGKPEAPRVLGYDAAGIVLAVGPDVTLFRPGDAVYYAGDVSRPGTNAERHLVDSRVCGPKPRTLDFAQAAAIPLTAITAWESFFDRMHIDPHGRHRGATLLIIGGAGGVGSIGIQIAKMAGLTVLATASRPETVDWVKSLGADHVIDHTQPLGPQIEALGMKHVDYIANFNNTDRYWDAMGELIRPQGAIALIVGATGALDMERCRAKCISVCWESMFTRPRFRTPDIAEQHNLLRRVAELIDAGTFRGTLREKLGPIDAATLRRAHAAVESGRTIGKVVVAGWPG